MVYLFHGEDLVAAEESLKRLLQEKVPPEFWEPAISRLDGETLSPAVLIEHCQALPFLSPCRAVIVEGLGKRLEQKGAGEAFLAHLRDFLPRLSPNTLLIFRERVRLAATHPLVALVRPLGEVREFTPPRGRDLSLWIAQEVRRQGAEITPAACDLLASTVGTDTAVLRHEVEKLVLYVGPQGRIDERLVAELASEARLSDIFALVDAIGQRRRARAMLELRRLLQAGQHPLYILSMIVRQFRLLLEVKGLPAGERRPEQVARVLGLHPFVAEKVVVQAQRLSREELESIYRRLVEVDREIKTGRRDGEVALELAVVEVAGL
ncbi:MAG: DNA polymerase III subunit delta [Chloroflexia bacterium]